MARKSDNFEFLRDIDELFHREALAAERAFVVDPSTTVFKMRLLAEEIAEHAAAAAAIYDGPGVDFLDLLRGLERRRIIEGDVARAFHVVRKNGNRAAHEILDQDAHRLALASLQLGRVVAVWFARSFGGKPHLKAGAFQKPRDPTEERRRLEANVARLRAELAESHAGVDKQAELLEEERRLREEAEAAERSANADVEAMLELAAEQEREAQERMLRAAQEAAQRARTDEERRRAAAAERRAADLVAASHAELRAENDRRLAELEAAYRDQIAKLQQSAAQEPVPVLRDRVEQAASAATSTELSEAETRLIIDDQLAAAGWEADTEMLRYSAGARPQKGRNLAIAEWPTSSGPADYALFVGRCLVAIVEAKKKAKNVPGALAQAKRYSRDYVQKGAEHPPGPALEWVAEFKGWPTETIVGGADADADAQGKSKSKSKAEEHYRIPFLYATNGREFHRQLEKQSGIWFLDARHPTNHPRALMGWPSPDGLKALLEQDIDDAHQKLHDEPTDYLGLRPYQLKAVEKVEEAIEKGQREVLLAMATGTGKTRTIIGLIYRLLKAGRFRRVLFLVDRSALGEQAQNAFKDMRLEANQTFSEIFEVKELGDIAPEPSTRVQVATVQGMVKRCLWPSVDQKTGEGTTDEHHVPVDQYDCIIVDESHRGYNLDQEMSEGEMEVRSLADYVSVYRRVLDHFDAVRIGLTATPALHTREIFGDAVFNYSYREAVVDGWLIDHEPPLRLMTKLSERGIHFEKGDEVTVIKPGAGVQLSMLDDEVDFEVADFNKKVIAPNFTKVVCDVLADHLDPTSPEKTLVFCVTDDHADRVVLALKEALAEKWGEIDDNLVQKITGATDKSLEAIRRYRNEKLPNIAVTVDLLTTGIDMPPISNLVFLRRVKSRILYVQMMGRATRLCDAIGKEVFRIFDAVDLYAALEDVSDMKPVVTAVNVSVQTVLDELQLDVSFTAPGRAQGTAHADDLRDQLVARLRRQAKRALACSRGSGKEPPAAWTESLEHLRDVTGHDPDGLADELNAMSAEKVRAYLADHAQLGAVIGGLFESLRGLGRGAVLADHEDEALAITHGYGGAPGSERQKPEDYLESFKAFVAENKNEIAALNVVLTRPRELTRDQLKELRLALHAGGYTSANIRTAWRDVTNQDIAASIVGWIRQQALGSPLHSYEERVDRALRKVKAMQAWTKPQQKWLDRIAKQLKKEFVIDEVLFDDGAFKSKGGFKGVDKQLGGKLEQVLDAFGDGIWEDAA